MSLQNIAKSEIINLFGTSTQKMALSLININSNSAIGNEETTTPPCVEYINHCLNLYPSLMKAFNDRCEKQQHLSPLEVADEIFTPVWINPSSCTKLTYPRKFDGDHRSESQYEKIGVYATSQLFAQNTNGNLCAALSSKYKYDSKGVEKSYPIVSNKGVDKKQMEYVSKRGIISVDEDGIPIPDMIRYIASYKRNDDKNGFSLISGSNDFLAGSVNILRSLETIVDKIQKNNSKNEQYKGVSLSRINIGDSSENSNGNKEYDQLSITFARLISGAIIAHDHLTVLKHVYKVKNLMEFDLSESDDSRIVKIDDVIDIYKPIKQYYVMATALNQIK